MSFNAVCFSICFRRLKIMSTSHICSTPVIFTDLWLWNSFYILLYMSQHHTKIIYRNEFLIYHLLNKKCLSWESTFSIKKSSNSVVIYKRPDFGFGNDIRLSTFSNFHYGWGISVQIIIIIILCSFSDYWIYTFKKTLTVQSDFL